MEELLKKIIDIEKNAQQVVEAAREERSHFDRDIQAQTSQIVNEFAQQTEAQISTMEKAQRTSMREKVSQLQAHSERQIREMDALLKQNAEQWAEQIFANVLKR